jgi:hypothetical protein
MSRRTRASACVLLACALAPAAAHGAAPRTPAGWRVEPAGTEIPISQAAVGFQGPLGAALSPAGRQPWVSGGGQGVLHALTATDGVLTETGTIPAGPFAAGLAYGRTPLGPYTQAGRVDSTHYDTASMVATIESLLGLPPMSITDARASRMGGAFVNQPRLAPYEAITPSVVPSGAPGAPTNPPTAPMAQASASWDLESADEAPELAQTISDPGRHFTAYGH